MRFLIVDQCSASKSHPNDAPVVSDERLPNSPQELIDDLGTMGIPACELYNGKQQRRISEAIRILRRNGHEVERLFISAGFGLVDESEELPPYDTTFSGMVDADIHRRSKELGITQDLLEKIDEIEAFDVVILPLGADYYSALDVSSILEALPSETMVVVFNREDDADGDHIISIPARTEEARENGSTVIGLKGTYLKRFATRLETHEGSIERNVVEDLIRNRATDQSQFEKFE